MNVHLISIEVSIEGSADTFVESECFSFCHFDFESHHADPVQTGLPVEDDNVPISEVPFNDISHSELDFSPR